MAGGRVPFTVSEWSFPVSARRLVCLSLLLIPVLASCRTAPRADAFRTPAQFGAALPARFSARQTVVFEFRPHWWWPPVHMTALGYVKVDRETGDYAVVCLSPLGMRIMEVSRSQGHSSAAMLFPFPAGGERAEQAMAADIAALYLDALPAPDAVMTSRGDCVVYRAGRDTREVEHEFSAATGFLTRKRIRDRADRTTVQFRDYRRAGEQVYPATAVLRNHRYGYTLTVRTTEFTATPAAP